MKNKNIKILIADDHQNYRNGLRSIIEDEPEMEIIAEAENGNSAVTLAQEFEPDVVIMDINMPELNGIDATRMIVNEIPDVKVIALSMYSEKQYVKGMLNAGVSGYLVKSTAFEELSEAITSVAGNQSYFSQKVADFVVHESKGDAVSDTTSTKNSWSDGGA